MATISRSSTYPNVLLVTGSDVVTGDYRANLVALLQAAGSSGPVRTGTHHAWATYQVGSAANPNHKLADWSVRPLPRLGVLELADPPSSTDPAVIGPRLGTLIHEFGHNWLVPRDLTVRSPQFWPWPDRLAPGIDGWDASQAFHDGTPYAGPAFVARQGSHWSAWVSTGGSCMDGTAWSREGTSDGLARWVAQPFTGAALQVPGLADLPLPARYGDADLVMMGVTAREEAFADEANLLVWMEPRLMAPMAYHAGLVIMFNPDDGIFFGYYRDHRTIAVQRTGQPETLISAPDNRPFRDPGSAVALRVIRRGTHLVFQARYDQLRTDLTPHLVDAAATWRPADGNPLSQTWSTVVEMDVPEPPQAVGVGVKTWNAILAEAVFGPLEYASGGVQGVYTVAGGLPDWVLSNTSGFSSLPARLVKYQPAFGPRFTSRGTTLDVMAPYSRFDSAGRLPGIPGFDHWLGVDRAPRALAAAPRGDFVIATTARLDRSGLSPGSGGATAGITMWGTERSIPMSQLVWPAGLDAVRVAPPGNQYRTAFIIVAAQPGDITMQHQQAVDAIRRYWDAAVPMLTRNRRQSPNSI
ncbi:hypothetical protein [Jatrophihabitans sp.]|uniref:hypothetical protein n=1 Tax=Jatrophihabitans sp. TaxID=1932789 RepID=UPI002F20C7B4